ncbi:alpha/beta-type small acid-soluble spore protein [Anaerobutyricum hallii]|nr:alpha/beta-type small acid-soluble spore protein [Anaerobutyricum hallii]
MIFESRGVFCEKKEKLFLGGEINLSELDADVQKKYEVAKELGIYDKVLEKGWGSLTAEETGRVGGVLRKRKNSGERVLS